MSINKELSDIEKLFQEDLEIYSKELIEMDELYSEMKKHFDKVKNNTGSGSGALNFLQKQAENLISLKSSKMSIVKDRVNTKKVMTELDMKRISMTKDEDKDEESFAKVANHVYNMILSNSKEELIKVKVDSSEPIDDEAIDKELDSILEQSKEDKTKEIEEEEPSEEVVVEVNEETGEENIIEENSIENIEESNLNDDDLDEEDIDKLLEQRIKDENITINVYEKNVDECIIEDNINEEHRKFHVVTDMNGELIAVDDDYNQLLDVKLPEWKIEFTVEEDELVARNQFGEVVEIIEIE